MYLMVVLLISLTGTAVLTDLRDRVIPNDLIVTGLFWGLTGQIFIRGMRGAADWAGGAVMPLLVLGILFYFRMMGAGDIKLLCMIGGFLGSRYSLQCIFYSILCGGAVSAVLIIKRNNLYSRLFYFKTYVELFVKTKQWSSYLCGNDEDGRFCFSVPVLMGLFCTLGGVL